MSSSWKDGFIAELENLAEQGNRGALATLRRGLIGSVPFEAYKYLHCNLTKQQEETALLIASLFALHPAKDGKGNLGDAFARIPKQDRSDSIEKRFVALLNSHSEDLRVHLRQAVSLLKSKGIPIDWRQLLDDVLRWDREDRTVQKSWAKSFWSEKSEETAKDKKSEEVTASPSAVSEEEEEGELENFSED